MPPNFADAYEEHVWDVYGYLAYRLRNRSEAEDLTQLTFERALRAWGRYDESKASLRTWLLAIAHNALIDHQRRERAHGFTNLSADRLSEGDLPKTVGPEEDVGLSFELGAALDTLNDRERSVLALRFGGDLPTASIAAILSLSVANVQQILSRSLRKLKRELEQDDVGRTGASSNNPSVSQNRPRPGF